MQYLFLIVFLGDSDYTPQTEAIYDIITNNKQLSLIVLIKYRIHKKNR